MTAPVPPGGVPGVLLPGVADVAARPIPDSQAELLVGIRRLERMFTGREPVELRSGLVPVGDGREMLAGTTARLLQVPYVARLGGLVVPAAAVPLPLHQVGVYITAADVFSVPLTPSAVEAQLERTAFGAILNFVATTFALHRRPGVPVEQTDLVLVDRWLAGDARHRVRNLLRDPKRRLVVPQSLYVLVKLAAHVCPDAVLPGVEAGRMPAALFGALSAMDEDGVGGLDDADQVVDTEIGSFHSRLLANQHLNKPLDEAHLMARFVRVWLELPAQRSGERDVVDVSQAFGDATEVPLRDVLVVAAALWANTVNGSPYVPPGYFADLKWDEARLAAALSLFTADPVTLRGLLWKETAEKGLVWSHDVLGRYPVVRAEDGGLLVLDRNLLVRRIFGGLLAFDIDDALKAGTRTDRKRAKHVAGCLQHLTEVYAMEIFEAVAAAGTAAPRVYGDVELNRAFSGKGRRIADAAVDYGDAWVVVEVTTSALTRESVAASREAQSLDVDKLVKKVEQIDHTIAALRAEERKLTGVRPAPVRRFYPLLVVTDGFPINPMSTEVFHRRVEREGLLVGDDVAPLAVVDIVELEMLEGLTEQGGPSLRDVLAGKERSAFYRTSVRDYLLLDRGLNPDHSQRVSTLMGKALDPALDALRPPAAA